MQTMGLSAADLAAYQRTLRAPHRRRVTIYVTTMTGAVLSAISKTTRMLSGSVTVDAQAEVSRALSLSLLDPSHSLLFDTDAPNDGALYLDRMIRVDYGVEVEALGRWVDVTVFLGPVTRLVRNEDVVEIEAMGKESLAQGEMYRAFSLPKNTLKTTAIRRLMAERAGESAFSIPASSARLPKALSIPGTEPAWKYATSLARGMSRQAFYDGRGILHVRPVPNSVSYAFKTGEGGDVLSPLAVTYSSEVKNVIVVTGGGSKPPVATAVAPSTSLLSPSRLGRNGVPRYLVERVTVDTLRTKAQCLARARSLLDDRLRTSVEVAFDSLVIPHLDAGDLVRVTTDEANFTFRLDKFTIPLVEGPMNVGYLYRARTVKGRIRP